VDPKRKSRNPRSQGKVQKKGDGEPKNRVYLEQGSILMRLAKRDEGKGGRALGEGNGRMRWGEK